MYYAIFRTRDGSLVSQGSLAPKVVASGLELLTLTEKPGAELTWDVATKTFINPRLALPVIRISSFDPMDLAKTPKQEFESGTDIGVEIEARLPDDSGRLTSFFGVYVISVLGPQVLPLRIEFNAGLAARTLAKLPPGIYNVDSSLSSIARVPAYKVTVFV